MFNVHMLITKKFLHKSSVITQVNLQYAYKMSSLLSPPLCSSNVRVCFHTMRSVSTVRNTFLKSSLSILFRLLHFPVRRFPPLIQSGAAFSTAAFSTPAFLLLPRCPVQRFQRPPICKWPNVLDGATN